MTYFKDLAPYEYSAEPDPCVLNVGWLAAGQPFPTGETSEAFQAALSELCKNHSMRHYPGHHECEFCPDASWDDPYYHEMGNGEIRVRNAVGTWYVAPRLIAHYVVEHHYCPPPEFVKAVENPSEIGRFELVPVSDETIREWDRSSRAKHGPRMTDAEIDRIVREGLRNTRPKTWWRFW